MDVDQVVLLGRLMLQEVIILAGPILAVASVVSLRGKELLNIGFVSARRPHGFHGGADLVRF